MDNFFENFADILGNLPQNPWAIVSLVVILVGFLAFSFFSSEGIGYRLAAFLLIFVGAAGIVYLAVAHTSKANLTTTSQKNVTLDNTEPQEVKDVQGGETAECLKTLWFKCGWEEK